MVEGVLLLVDRKKREITPAPYLISFYLEQVAISFFLTSVFY